LDDGTQLATDGLLGRMVRLRGLAPEEVPFFQSLSSADGPFLQAIFDIDPELERVVLEHPKGEPMTRALLDDAMRAVARAQVGEALKTLHARGVTHGDIRASNIVVAAGRAVLLLPQTPATVAPERDFAALDALF
jgi:tRNA A-37 threonylcarbamoyl transferase component Bud32